VSAEVILFYPQFFCYFVSDAFFPW
jgi:hypothetical protein